MNRWTRLLLGASLLGLSLIAMSACSLRYDFTQCEVDADCSRLETTAQTDPAQNELYQCQSEQCVLLGDVECRDNDDCAGDDECNAQRRCESTIIDPDTDGGMDSGDAQDTQDTQDTQEDIEEVIENTCEDTQECLDDENFGEGYACSSDNECVESACSDDTFCTDTFGDDYACGPDDECVTTTCEETTYCNTNFGENVYCGPDGTCLDTTRAGCEDLFYPPDLPRDEVVILGSIVPVTAGFESIGPTIRNGVRMAVREFAGSAGRLLNNQTVAHLQCAPGSDGNAVEMAEHMQALGVPAIVGPVSSQNYLDVVRQVTGNPDDNPIVTMAMGATSPAIESNTAAGTFSFQLIANDRFQSSALTDLTKVLKTRSCTDVSSTECTDDLECQAQFGDDWVFDDSDSTRPCTDPDPKVAVFYKDDKYGNDLKDLTQVRFNDRYPDAQVEFYQYPNPADLGFDPDQIASEYGTVVASSLSGSSALPDADIAMFIGTGEAVQAAAIYINAVANAGQDPTTRTYMFSHGAAADAPNLLENFSSPEDYIERIEAVAPNIFNTTDNLYESWQFRYSTIFNEPAQTSVGGIAYDAAFYELFAMTKASADGDVTAETISQALQSGDLQDASANRILFKDPTFPGDAKTELGRGNNVDLVGVSGDLNFVFEEVNGDQVNQGIVRQNYLGLKVNERNTPQGVVYEGVPARLYLLAPGENFGTWSSL